MNQQPKREGMLGVMGHEVWEADKKFSSKEEVDACISSMIAKGVKGGELGHDPTKKEIETGVKNALVDKDPTTLTPADIANQIEDSLYGSHYGKTEFKRPKSIPEREDAPAPAL